MKKILTLITALMIGTAYAQEGSTPMDSSSGARHMFEFNADSVLGGALSFDKSKTRGKKADNDTQLDLALNYAYSIPAMPRLQLGSRMLYIKDVNSLGDQENYGLQVGAIMNHSQDLINSAYASLYVGLLWNNQYEKTATADDDEVRIATLAVGKRFALERWGLKHIVYSPEIALQTRNSTTGSSFEYTQDLQLRFLQFSVFF